MAQAVFLIPVVNNARSLDGGNRARCPKYLTLDDPQPTRWASSDWINGHAVVLVESDAAFLATLAARPDVELMGTPDDMDTLTVSKTAVEGRLSAQFDGLTKRDLLRSVLQSKGKRVRRFNGIEL